MITTKKGSEKEGLNININSNTMFFSGYLAFPETQHSYSAGTGGKYNNNSVWGISWYRTHGCSMGSENL